MEDRLAPLYARAVTLSIALFVIGLFVPIVLWAGVAVLVAMPFLSAITVMLEAQRTQDSSLIRLVLASLVGVGIAVVLGFALR